MMSLRSIKLPTEVVEVPGTEGFSVRGLSLTDCTALARKHGPALVLLFDQFKNRAASLDPDDVALIGNTLLEVAPELAIEIISLASRGEVDLELASELPFPVAIDALEKIAVLTFSSEAAVKKLLETVTRVARTTVSTVNSLTTN